MLCQLPDKQQRSVEPDAFLTDEDCQELAGLDHFSLMREALFQLPAGKLRMRLEVLINDAWIYYDAASRGHSKLPAINEALLRWQRFHGTVECGLDAFRTRLA